VNHRELVLGRGRMAPFKFFSLPESLQDGIIEGLDSRRLTFLQAEALARQQGHKITDTAIWAYYRALSLERHKHTIAEPLFKDLEGLSAEKKIRRLMNVCLFLLAKLYASEEVDVEKLQEAAEVGVRVVKAALGRGCRVRHSNEGRAIRDCLRRKPAGV